ncbi:hypothetical protein Lal_00009834 [Lupinus albus]|nr:hypothetical protein Lal_00009834 [Lupinus albus]
MASRSLSNNSFGTVPSNSLNLRSRNFSFGNPKTTTGNFPANRLLLRSNSNRIFSFSNFLGTVPQKRENSLLPRLECHVSIPDAVVFKN